MSKTRPISRQEVQNWLSHPVTENLFAYLQEAYNTQVLLESAHNTETLYRAKGIREIINILNKPAAFVGDFRAEDQENINGTVSVTFR